ncbi:MAG: cupin domain-containing protein [Gammaproteobacteria bacterium]|nr:cupin domain-containing protein [Gammaproteobacteria bacterium]
MWQLANFDIDEFLADYWQQQPLLIRQALPGFQSPISAEELAGLACEQGVHSRLVIEQAAESPWLLHYGPFSEEDFTSLPQTHYSLLVSECEKWLPELRPLVELFNFIPSWRIDDLMISYAPDQGSVGPHIDEYDVFLLQASGRRHWSIIDHKLDKPDIIPNLDLALLQEFEADREWTLEPGDMLYLPPKIAHHGVAVGDGCMTYSVGFRAPAASDVMDSFLLETNDQGLTNERYRDIALDRQRDPAEITDGDIQQFKAMAHRLLDQSGPLWPDIVGKLVSDTTLAEDIKGISCETLQQAADYHWQQHPDSRIFYHHASELIRLYANGQVWTLVDNPQNIDFCQMLCSLVELDIDQARSHYSAEALDLLLQLIQANALIPIADESDAE